MSDKSGKETARKARTARLAKALRDNLGRRKGQARESARLSTGGAAAPSNRRKDER